MRESLVITGGLGFLGREVLARLLLQNPNSQIALLVRARNQVEAIARVHSTLQALFDPALALHYAERITVVCGDLCQENFGIGARAFEDLARTCTRVIHCAASTQLNGKLESLREINVGGTHTVVQFARLAAASNPEFIRLEHVSTAYVAGSLRETVLADRLESQASFRNHYERTKAEAEEIVRGLDGVLDYIIYRPSIIVGNSRTGHTSAFNVLYVPAKLLARGILRALPAIPHIPFDIVPVDYVADAIVEIGSRRTPHARAFHLCAGVGRESTPGEVMQCMFDTLNKYRDASKDFHPTPPLFCPDSLLKLSSSLHAAKETMRHLEEFVCRQLRILKQIVPFLPYMISNPRFDTAATNRELHGKLPPAPLFHSYAEQVFKFCLDTDWGRIPVTDPVFPSYRIPAQ